MEGVYSFSVAVGQRGERGASKSRLKRKNIAVVLKVGLKVVRVVCVQVVNF